MLVPSVKISLKTTIHYRSSQIAVVVCLYLLGADCMLDLVQQKEDYQDSSCPSESAVQKMSTVLKKYIFSMQV